LRIKRKRSIIYDGRGSVRQSVSDSGAVTKAYAYDPYGGITLGLPRVGNVYGYNGELQNAKTGLQYLRARYYASEEGRFTSEDTYFGDQQEPLTLHKYLYVSNDPYNHVDPSGNTSVKLPRIDIGTVATNNPTKNMIDAQVKKIQKQKEMEREKQRIKEKEESKRQQNGHTEKEKRLELEKQEFVEQRWKEAQKRIEKEARRVVCEREKINKNNLGNTNNTLVAIRFQKDIPLVSTSMTGTEWEEVVITFEEIKEMLYALGEVDGPYPVLDTPRALFEVVTFLLGDSYTLTIKVPTAVIEAEQFAKEMVNKALARLLTEGNKIIAEVENFISEGEVPTSAKEAYAKNKATYYDEELDARLTVEGLSAEEVAEIYGNESEEIHEAEKAREEGKPRNKHKVEDGKSLPTEGEPNSSADILNPDGSVKQRRYYGPDGKAQEDIDFNHSDDGTHEFPHRHQWEWKNGRPTRK
jgi:RHS repeat-associated core domain